MGTPHPAPEPLKPEDFPNVKNWQRPTKSGSAHKKCIIVTDLSDVSGDTVDGLLRTPDNEEADDDDPSDKAGVPAFLVGTDGKLLSNAYKVEMYASARAFLNEHITPNNVPLNYSSAGESLLTNFRNYTEGKPKALRLCKGHWKANQIFIRLWHSWLRSYRRRMTKQGHEIKIIEKKKRKRKTSGDEDEDEEDEVEEQEEPLPKKKKQKRKVIRDEKEDGEEEEKQDEPPPKAKHSKKPKVRIRDIQHELMFWQKKAVLKDSVVQPQVGFPIDSVLD